MGIGHLARQRGPQIIQASAVGTTNSGLISYTTASSWPVATTVGNLLVAVVSTGAAANTVNAWTFAGWTLAVELRATSFGAAIYYIANSGSRSGAETITTTLSIAANSTTKLQLFELKNMATASPLDKTASNTNSG